MLVIFHQEGQEHHVYPMSIIARILSKRHDSVEIGKIDVSNIKTAAKFKIEKAKDGDLPILRWYSKGKESPYEGKHDTNSVLDFVLRQGGVLNEHRTCEDLAKSIHKEVKYENDGSDVHHDLKLVYFGDDKHNPLYGTFEAAASHNHDAYEFITTEAKCASTYGAQANGVAVIRNFNEPYTVYHKGNDPVKLAKWMSYLAVPHYSHMDE